MCICHWLLGIGDRHLSNTLVCKKTGKALGIDFGLAFGTATQIQPVPELVPFRLTPHITYLMAPFEEHGRFKESMVKCLYALRKNSQPLIATLNVFIEEPSLEWVEYASRFQGDEESNVKWYPSEKINQAKRKLCGANSVHIMIEELTMGHSGKKYLEAYIAHVKGNPSFNARARMAQKDLSVEDQVECLIDHAKDYNLLGRMYAGWTPWV